MRKFLLLCIVMLLASTAVYIVYARPVVAPTTRAPSLWLSPSEWHWPGETVECVSYMCGVGDTLWGIAERYYPERDPREVVWAIRKVSDLEHLGGPALRPGQVIIIPDPELYGVGVR